MDDLAGHCCGQVQREVLVVDAKSAQRALRLVWSVNCFRTNVVRGV